MTNLATVSNSAALATAVIDRADMTAAMEIVTHAVERKNRIPILGNVRIVAADPGFAFVTATDLDVAVTVRIPAAVDPGFAMTIPALQFRDLLKKAAASDHVALTAPTVHTVQRQNGTEWDSVAMKHVPMYVDADECDGPAVLDFERVKFTLNALPVSDFPDLKWPDNAKAHRFTMTGADFRNGIDRVSGAISNEETRYYLNGIFMHAPYNSGAFRMVATDGHRLYRQDFAVPDGADGMPGVIVPTKTVKLLDRYTKGKKCPDAIGIEVTETRMRLQFTTPDGLPVTVMSKLVDGTFPDYQRVIPTGNDKECAIASEAALEAIASVSLISSQRGRTVKLSLSEDRCRFSVSNPDEGSAETTVQCAYRSDEIEIGFSARYLAEIIATAGGDEITMMLADSGSPALFRRDDLEGWLGLLMPIRI